MKDDNTDEPYQWIHFENDFYKNVISVIVIGVNGCLCWVASPTANLISQINYVVMGCV